MANYKTEAEALAAAGVPGWSVTGREREFENVTTKDDNNQSVTTKQATGNTILTVQSPDGKKRDTITVGSADDPSVKGGKTITVVKGAGKDVAGNVASSPSGWTPVYRVPNDASSGQIGQWDPVNNEFHPQAADPSAKPTGTYDNVIDPNDPSHKRVIGIVDKGDASWHPISTTADGKQVITTPTAIYSFDKDSNALTKLTDVDQKSPQQAVILDGKVYTFDPAKGTFTLGPVSHPDIKDANQNPMVWQDQPDGSGKYVYPAGVSPAATVGNSTTLKELVWYDNQGNEVSRKPNPNYVETPAQAASPNTTAPYIQVPDPQHPSQLIWVENKARVTASQALKDLASHLTGQVVDGNISVDEAKALIEASNQRMTTETAQQQNATTAATGILANTRGNAQTGAGLLQQRVQAATGTLQSILGNALQNKNITSIPGDVGANLVGGLQGWTAELMGGQGTLDSAARLVQQADPSSNLADPTTQSAIATLKQMLDKHQELTGAPHPAVVATQAAQQSAQNGGMTAPGVQTQDQTVTADPNQWYRDWQARQAADAAQQQLAQQIALQQFSAPGQVAGQNYGANTAYTGGVAPWNAQPGPSFIAPAAAPQLASSG